MIELLRGTKAALVILLVLVSPTLTGFIKVAAALSEEMIINPAVKTVGEEVALSSVAKKVEGEVNVWDVTLKIEAEKSLTTSDTVFVIDRSGSMLDGDKMYKAKQAARTLALQLLQEEHASNRIAVISYANQITLDIDFSDSYTEVVSAINSLRAYGGTFTQGAMHMAAELLENSEADIKNMVLLSDGKPTFSYKLDKMEDYLVKGGPGGYENERETGTEIPQSAFMYDSIIGNGIDTYTCRIEWDKVLRSSERICNNHINSTIAEAAYFKNSGSGNLYTVALKYGNTNAGEEVLARIASPGKAYGATVSNLTDIFSAIGADILPTIAKNTDVEGIMKEGITISAESLIGQVGTGKLDWKPEFMYDDSTKRYVAEVTYRVEANDNILKKLDAEGYALLNTKVVVRYGKNQTIDFPIPKVKPFVINMKKELVGQNCEECEFDTELTFSNNDKRTYVLRTGEVRSVVNRLPEGRSSIREVGTRSNVVPLEEYIVEYINDDFIIDSSRSSVNLTVRNIYEAKGSTGDLKEDYNKYVGTPESGDALKQTDSALNDENLSTVTFLVVGLIIVAGTVALRFVR